MIIDLGSKNYKVYFYLLYKKDNQNTDIIKIEWIPVHIASLMKIINQYFKVLIWQET